MSAIRGVLDTSVVIALPAIRDPRVLPEEPAVTAVTIAELSVGPLVSRSEVERANRQAVLQQALSDFEPLPFDSAAAAAFGRVASALRASGRKRRARAFDALIAATALSQGLPVFTANPDDFEGIPDLEVCPVTVS